MKLFLLCLLMLLAWAGWRAWRTGPTPPVDSLAPAFSLPDQSGQVRNLQEYSGRWLVLYFYPKDDTPGCTTEACGFRDGILALRAAGAEVLGVSVDTVASHRRFAQHHALPFSLLADVDGHVSRKYGVLMDWGIVRMAKRRSFLIDPTGKLRKVYIEVDPTLHHQQILDDLQQAARIS